MEDDKNESAKRAELFDVLTHPTRIKILRLLGERPRSFSELKRELEIESSGNLQYHLGRLGNFVKQDASGKYTINDDAREALRFLDFAAQASKQSQIETSSKKPNSRKLLAGLVLIALILLATAFFVYYQIVLSSPRSILLYNNVDLSKSYFSIGGKKFSYVLITAEALENGTKVTFRGLTFTYLESLVYRLPPLAQQNKGIVTNISKVVSLVSGPGMEVKYEDGKTEIIPILPWIWKSGEEAEVNTALIIFVNEPLKNQNSTYVVVNYLSLLKTKTLAFQVGPKTIMLLVNVEQQ
ncbi:MAG: ArsR/SmtB family transcription factor [Thermoproteota archaeon]